MAIAIKHRVLDAVIFVSSASVSDVPGSIDESDPTRIPSLGGSVAQGESAEQLDAEPLFLQTLEIGKPKTRDSHQFIVPVE